MLKAIRGVGCILLVGALGSCGLPGRWGDEQTDLGSAAASGRVDEVQRLLSEKADPNAADSAGLTPLVLAVDHMQVAVVRVLLAAGAHPIGPAPNLSLLHRVVSLPKLGVGEDEQWRIDVAQALVDGGVDPCLRDEVDRAAGQWPSDIAERREYRRLMTELRAVERTCR